MKRDLQTGGDGSQTVPPRVTLGRVARFTGLLSITMVALLAVWRAIDQVAYVPSSYLGKCPAYLLRLAGISGMAAILLGLASLSMMAETSWKGRQSDAKAGMIRGVLGILPILIVYLTLSKDMSHEMPRLSRCMTNLRQIHLACQTYAIDNQGVFPDRLSRLYPEYLSDLDIFRCPSTGYWSGSSDRIDDDTTYLYAGGRNQSSHPHALLACDRVRNHSDGSFAVIHVDGSFEWIPAPRDW